MVNRFSPGLGWGTATGHGMPDVASPMKALALAQG